MIHTSINGNVKGVSRIYWIWYWHRLQGYVDLATSWYEIFVMISSYRFKFTSFGSNRQISVIYEHESIPNNKINNEFPTWANGLLANFLLDEYYKLIMGLLFIKVKLKKRQLYQQFWWYYYFPITFCSRWNLSWIVWGDYVCWRICNY